MTDRPERAREWLDLVLDEGWTELFQDVLGTDVLRFPGYPEQLETAHSNSGEKESVIVAQGTVDGRPAVAFAFEFAFLGGSMGTAAGERIARAFDLAAQSTRPVIGLVASGGARMQEGILALAQMPATVAARARLARARMPFIAYLRNPTTGGVYASFASLADFLWAEPGATIGFAGPRVAEATTGVELPEGSHTAESALDAGTVADVVEPDALRERVARTFSLLEAKPRPVDEPDTPEASPKPAWQQVLLARNDRRPSGAQYLAMWEANGLAMRLAQCGDDPTVITAVASIAGRPVTVIAQDRHADDGRTRPAGYRRAREAIELAVRLGLPIVTLVDTPGADPGPESEAGGIASEIARTFEALLRAPVPTVACVVGEGGSGGALALAACDRLLIQENAIFAVIAPEAAAAILKREDVEQVAESLRLTATDLLELGVADAMIGEPPGGAHNDPAEAWRAIERWLAWTLDHVSADIEARSAKWRKRE